MLYIKYMYVVCCYILYTFKFDYERLECWLEWRSHYVQLSDSVWWQSNSNILWLLYPVEQQTKVREDFTIITFPGWKHLLGEQTWNKDAGHIFKNLHYANKPALPLWPLCQRPNIISQYLHSALNVKVSVG